MVKRRNFAFIILLRKRLINNPRLSTLMKYVIVVSSAQLVQLVAKQHPLQQVISLKLVAIRLI